MATAIDKGNMIAYIWKRWWQRYATTRSLSRHSVSPGFYLISPAKEDIDAVTFELSDPVFVHLGDQLFYEPSMHWMRAAGLPVSVCPTAHLVSYFSAIGIHVVRSSAEISPNTLHVVPLASYRPEEHAYKNTLVVDFADPDIDEPLCDALFSALCVVVKLDPRLKTAIDRSARLKKLDTNLALPPRSVLFSNYIDSGRFRMRKAFLSDLRHKAIELRKKGHTIVHVGSANDKAKDNARYEFVDIDMRGKTTPLELICCFHEPAVCGAVTFDNFVMHASLMAGKPTFVKFRGRYTAAARRHHYQHVNEALAPPGEHLVQYI
jgi:hypothetical protein